MVLSQMKLREKLKLIRKTNKQTQPDFAKSISVSLSTYKRYELGDIEISMTAFLSLTEKHPEYSLWLISGETIPSAGQISPNDEKPKMEGAAVPAELLNAAFEQTLTTSIELGWITPKESVNFSMLSDLLRHDFVQKGGRLIEPVLDETKPEAG